MATPQLYYHCASFLTENGLNAAAILAVPGLGAALMYIQRRRIRAHRDH